MRTIAIINQKGGCGKTTTAINLAGMLAYRGARVLLVDLDPQSHCAAGLGVPEQRLDLDIGDAMLAAATRGVDPGRLLWRVGKNLDLAPSRMKLAGLEAARGGLADKNDRDRRLAMVLQRLSPNYDAAIIDCSPSIGLLTFNALAAADTILIPVETSFFSLQGATKQYNTIESLSRRMHHNAEAWILPTIHVPDNSLAKDLLEEVRRRFGDRVAPVVIRRDASLSEAATYGRPVVDHAPASEGAQDYMALAAWLEIQLTKTVRTDVAAEPVGGSIPLTPSALIEPELTSGVRTEELMPGPMSSMGAGSTNEQMMPAAEPAARAPAESRPVAGTTRSLADDIAALASRMRREPARTPSPDMGLMGMGGMTGLAPRTAATDFGRIEVRRPKHAVVRADDEPGQASSPATSVQRLLGARETAQGVLFVQPLGLGRRVAIAGDFNGWSADSHILRVNPVLGVMELCVPLATGQHRYRLVIDGRWCLDPYNTQYEPDPLGGFSSLINVTQEHAAHPAVPA